MNGKLVKTALIALGCSVALVGCGTYNHQASSDQKSASQVASVSSHQSKRVSKRSAKNQSQQPQQVQQLVSSTYHFKFDNSELSSSAKAELDQFAHYLSQNPSSKVHVEGYTDKKGKDSYNLALGMRRAQSVANYLQQQGVKESQIETRSFGAEKPADMGESTDSLARNRRAVVYFEVDSDVV